MSNVICPNSIRYFTLAFFTKTIISLAFFFTLHYEIDFYRCISSPGNIMFVFCSFISHLQGTGAFTKKCVIPSSWQKKIHPPCYTLYSCYFYISIYKHIFFANI